MKSSQRTLALSVIVCLTLACATLTNPQVLLGGRATPTLPVSYMLETPENEATGLPKLPTQLAGSGSEAATQLAGSGSEAATQLAGSGSEMLTQVAGTLEAALGSGTEAAPGATAKPSSKVTPGAPSQVDANASIRVVNALDILLGNKSGTKTLPSYHLEVKRLSPVMSGGAVAQAEEQVSADVQGANVHFTDTNTKPGAQPVVKEGYIIGDTSYDVKDGKVLSTLSTATLTWSSWPLDAFFVFGMGSLKTTSNGVEQLEGRDAEVYTLGGTAADDSTGALSAVGMPVSAVKGQVWVDKATGALLKAMLDYKMPAADSSGGSSTTTGDGRLEITVTQVGQVTVKDPTK